MRRIPFLEPEFPDPMAVAQDYAAIVARHIFTNSGPIECELARGLAHAIGEGVQVSVVSSGTMGLQLAMQACLRSGRPYVLVPSFTFAAGPLCILWAGFTPVFIDIDASSWQPNLYEAQAFLKEHADKTAGILLCNTFGVANLQITEWEALADTHQLPVIVDSAAGFGTTYPWNERLGARGTCEVFSLHATKTLGVGEGGAVSSRDPQVIADIDRLKNFGFDANRGSSMMGTNGKLSELSAAIGLRQLGRLEANLSRRQQIFDAYRSVLEPLGFSLQELAGQSALAFASALFPSGSSRDHTLEILDHRGVEVRTYYNPPVHRQPLFSNHKRFGELPVTEDICRRIVSLPMSMSLTDVEVAHILDAIREGLGAGGRSRFGTQTP